MLAQLNININKVNLSAAESIHCGVQTIILCSASLRRRNEKEEEILSVMPRDQIGYWLIKMGYDTRTRTNIKCPPLLGLNVALICRFCS